MRKHLLYFLLFLYNSIVIQQAIGQSYSLPSNYIPTSTYPKSQNIPENAYKNKGNDDLINWLSDNSNMPGNIQAFEENIGQYKNPVNADKVLYGCYYKGATILFTEKSVIFSTVEVIKSKPDKDEKENKKEEGEEEEKEEEERIKKTKIIPHNTIMGWENCNIQPVISAINETPYYFCNSSHAHIKAYKELIYHTIYPGIDVEFKLTDKGIAYSILVEPGYDASIFRMHYSGDEKGFEIAGDRVLHIKTHTGEITDQAPLALQDGQKISLSFQKVSNNTIALNASQRDITKKLTVKAGWSVSPTTGAFFPTNIGMDAVNNAYVQGTLSTQAGTIIMYVQKYSAAGALKWTYKLNEYTNTPFNPTEIDSASVNPTYATDLAVDPTGNCYVPSPLTFLNATGNQYAMVSIDSLGKRNYLNYNSPTSLYETWNVSFSCATSTLIEGGSPTYQESQAAAITASSGTIGAKYSSTVTGEIYAGRIGSNGLYYALTGTTGPTNGSLLCCSISGGTVSQLWSLNLNYAWQDADRKSPYSVASNAIAVGCQYVYTSDGVTLDQRSLTTGALVDKVTIAGGINTPINSGIGDNSGIAVDPQCGYVYVGSDNTIYVYDENLNMITSHTMPGMVYDIAYNNGVVSACGANPANNNGFVTQFAAEKCASNIKVTHTNILCSTNNGTATATATFCTSPYSYLWLPSGQTTQTATGLSAGTYTVNIGTQNGCTTVSDTVVILDSVGGLDVKISTSNLANCTTNLIATVSGGYAPYTYSWSPTGGSNAIATGLSAGTYTIIVISANGCKDSAMAIITQPTQLQDSIPAVNVLCNGGNNGSATVYVKGGTPGYTFSWTPSGGTGATASNLTAGTYTVLVTDNNGCKSTAEVTITEPRALATTTSFTPAFCNLSNGSATVNVTGGVSPYTYSWNPAGGTNATATGISAGIYTVKVIDSNGCAITSPVTITQPAAIIATIKGTTGVSCNGGTNGTATVTATGGTIPYTYAWVTTPVQTTSIATGLSAGTYTVSVTDSNGCISGVTAIITEPPLLTTTTIPTNVLCNGSNTGNSKAIVTGGTLPYTYLWASGNSTATATGLSAGTYTLTVTDANGCISTATTTITQPTALGSTISFTPAFCNLSNGSVTVAVTGGTPPYKYVWNPSNENTVTATGIPIGTYTVTVTDNNGCTTTNSVTVTQPPALLAIITGTTPVSCFGGNNGTASATETGGTSPYTYLWEPGANSNAMAVGLDANTYTLLVTDANGCTSSATTTVTQPTLLTVSIKGPLYLCAGAVGILTATPTGGTSPYTYSWSPGISSTTDTASITPAIATTYTVIVTDANGCKATDVFTVSISSSIAATVSGAASVCSGNSIILCANTVGGTGGNLYTWQPGNDSTPCITVSPSVTTTYSVSVMDQCGSSATASATAWINPLPFVDFAADLYQGCKPLCIQFYNNSSVSGQSSYSWSFGNGDTALKTNHPIYCYQDSGYYTVTLTVTSDSGCSATRRKINLIHVFGLPDAAFTISPQPANILSPTIQFTDQTTDPLVNRGLQYWTWTYGDNLDSVGTTQNTMHTYQDTGTYCVTLAVMDHKGCTDTVTNCLVIDPIFTLYIPNAFTPNGDGMDDIFTAKGVYVKDFQMYIFDRWGEQLYHTNDINKGWNGTVKGGTIISQEDVYVYKILATDWQNHQHTYIGRVTLLK